MVLLFSLAAAGCYEQPVVPRDKPVRCGATLPRCPIGLLCVADLCAPETCEEHEDCPLGLFCSARQTCGPPSDEGLDAGGDGGLADGAVGPGGPDAPGSDLGTPDALGTGADAPPGVVDAPPGIDSPAPIDVGGDL